jgi:serine/threonine protein phosphatase 1
MACLDSYGDSGRPDLIPKSHFEFLKDCVSYFETDTHLFVHANYRQDLPLATADDYTLRWLSLRDFVPEPHTSGKVAVMGHTPQLEVLDMGHFICIDTNCCIYMS